MYWDEAEVAMHPYVPKDRDDATVSTTNTTISTTNMAEQMMLNLYDDVYNEDLMTIDWSENEEPDEGYKSSSAKSTST